MEPNARTGSAGGVLLVLPAEFTANGKRAVIKNSFPDVLHWQPLTLDSQRGWILERGTY